MKERKIGYVKTLVELWRQKHIDGKSLDEAADELHISRKTLDDYYSKINRAKFIGFDLEKYQDYPMGFLRRTLIDY